MSNPRPGGPLPPDRGGRPLPFRPGSCDVGVADAGVGPPVRHMRARCSARDCAESLRPWPPRLLFARRLSDAQLAEMMGLLRGSDTVELKLTVPAAQQRDAIRALGLDALDAQIRQVIFFDTPDLALDRAGVVVRARRIQGRVGDSVIKLRPLDPEQVGKDVRQLSGFGVEVDAIPGGFVCSGRLKCEADSDAIRQVVLGERALRKLYTKEQRALYRAHAPDGIELDDLAVLGPIFVLKLKWQPRGFARKMVAEMWLYPDGARIFELSTKCLPGEAFQVAAEARVFLSEHGIDLSGEQQTKTRTALEFFAAELAAG